MLDSDRRPIIDRQDREDPSLDFEDGPEEKAWDEEDGLFDNEEIVVS